ncbi:MAG: Hint domain-containing protein [Albidovulum sp.]
MTSISQAGLSGTDITNPAAAAPQNWDTSARSDRNWTLPGLCWNTKVTTSFGDLPVQVLRKFDPLRLGDGTIARVAWVDKIQLDGDFLSAYPDAQPVLIRAGALGNGLPTQDTLVSPHQTISVMTTNFRAEQKLARNLLGRPGVLRKPQSMITYYMFHCGKPANVNADGMKIHTAPNS